jgi:hypothetical protein
LPSQITLSKFQEAYENNLLKEIFSITVNNEKRVYAKTVEGQANNPKQHIVVYAVVP